MKTEQELVTKHAEIKAKIDKLTEEKNEVRGKLAEILHYEGVNDKIIEDDYGVEWQVAYQISSRKKVNYSLLLEEVGSNIYDEIVTSNETTSFVVKKAPKKKKPTNLTKKAPKKVERDTSKTPPKGKIEH